MSNFLYHHLGWHHQFSEMGELYISFMLRSLGIGIGAIFVPIYLFYLGYSLTWICIFFLVSTLMRYPVEFLNGHFVSRFGSKHVLTASFLALIVYFVVLQGIPYWSGWLWVAAFFLALEMSWYWVARNMHMSQNRSHDHGSRQISQVIILQRIAAAIGPLIGGLVGALLGLEFSLLLASLVLVAAAYPLFRTQDYYERKRFKFRGLKMPYTALSYLGLQVNSITTLFMWPLFIYLALGAYESIGFIIAITVVLGGFITYFIGKLGDKGKNPLLLTLGSIMEAITNGLRGLTSTFGSVLGVNLMSDLSAYLIAGPATAIRYDQSDTTDRLNFVLNCQLWAVHGKSIAWMLLVVFSMAFSTHSALQAIFIVSAVAALLIPLISRQKMPI